MSKINESGKKLAAILGSTKAEKTVNIVSIVVLIVFLPILILNMVLIVKTAINPDEIPSIGNSIPLIVLTESMEPKIHDGDLIIVKKADIDDIDVGDVISYYDPDSRSNSIVTHRVIEVLTDESGKSFRTMGDNNDVEDRLAVPAKNIIGVWEGFCIRFLGNIMLFMQSTLGLIVCIGIPVAALIVYEVVRRKRSDNAKQNDIEALRAELEAMKAEKEKAENQPENNSEE